MVANVSDDASSESLFYFRFIFTYGITAGYDTDSSTYYSQIRISFDNSNGYLNDLGTGLQQDDEVGCASLSGLTTNVKKRLKCTIDLGTGAEDLPAIIV